MIKGSYKFHAIITTFEMILTDCPELRNIPWRCVVIDEAHRLKNRNCKLLEGLKMMDLVSGSYWCFPWTWIKLLTDSVFLMLWVRLIPLKGVCKACQILWHVCSWVYFKVAAVFLILLLLAGVFVHLLSQQSVFMILPLSFKCLLFPFVCKYCHIVRRWAKL